MAEVDAIWVVYRKTERAVESVRAMRRQSAASRITCSVVDNSVAAESENVLRAGLPEGTRLSVMPRNLGYSRGVNWGAREEAGGNFILLISPDVIVEDLETVEKMVDIMRAQADIGVLATLQRNDDGSWVEVARRFPSPVKQMVRRLVPGCFSEINLTSSLLNGTRDIVDVDWVQSSFVMIRRPVWEEIGGLSEAYDIFMADVEFCMRVWRMGYRVSVTAAVEVRADGIRASGGGFLALFRSRPLRIHVRDALVYYLRNIWRGKG